jgi:hypothetical protein
MSSDTKFASGSTDRSIPSARQYTARDFAGHVWTFTQTVANVEPGVWGGEMVE